MAAAFGPRANGRGGCWQGGGGGESRQGRREEEKRRADKETEKGRNSKKER